MTDTLAPPAAQEITATIVFADLVGFDRLSAASGTEKAYLAVTHLLRQLDTVARQYGGSVDKYLGDKLMAIFGHPLPLEHPDRAAAMAALEMRRRVALYNREADLEVPLGIHVGINSGRVVSGEVRGPVVREFHVLGDVVNVAARINARSPDGEIWVGPDVHASIEGTLEARALEPLVLKGKSHPVEVFALDAPRLSGVRDHIASEETPPCGFVGRAAELAAVEAGVRALAAGQGGAIHIEGDAGSGKSRLLAELGASAAIDGLTTLAIEARGVERAQGGSVFASLLEFVTGETARGASIGDEILGRLEKSLRTIAREQPLLLVVEDVHAFDREAVWLLDRLRALGTSEPLVVLSTGLSVPTPNGAPRDGPSPEALLTIELGLLTPEEARELVVGVLDDDVEARTLDLVLDRGGRLPGSLLRAAFLAPVLRSEFEQASSRDERSSEAERRRATVVFADLTGFTAMTETLGAERSYPVVASCLEILDLVAREHGGTVDHYLGDCVMATFGVPRAIEDAPRAAINAAIDMRARIRSFSAEHALDIPVDVHTGVATGLGIAGDISGPMIREFAFMGDHVDRADALTHLAEAGEIFVDEATRKMTREVFEFASAQAAVLPGADAPQPTFEVRSQAAQRHRKQVGSGRQVFSELVGRDSELGAIRSAIETVKAGQGGVISLSAEAGIGKSRLLTEVSASRELEGAVWLVGRALSNGRNFGYHPVADLLRSWTQIDDDDDDASARAKLDQGVSGLLPDDEHDTAALLANTMGLELSFDERARIESIQGEAADKVVRAAFVRLLRAAAAVSPLVIVMEDLHWADLSTIELVESILGLSDEQPILFMNAFRPGYEETSGRILAASRSEHARQHVELSLVALDANAARQMVKNLFRGGDVPQRTRAAIEERAQGNPFYIEEVVRTLVDLGAVEVHEGAFRATEKLEAVQIPDTVQEAVMARVDRLDLRRRSVLQAAAVIGGNFHVEVLADVFDGTGLEGFLNDLHESEFITPSDRTAGAEYGFKHPLIPEIIYDSLLESRREELHLAVAEATESKLSEALPGYFAMLAFHFSRGRDLNRAEDYLFRAGDEASRSAASNEALHFFQEASALFDELHSNDGETEKRARLEKSLAIALMNRGRLIEAVDHFDGAARLLGHDSPRTPVRMGMSFTSNVVQVLGRLYMRRILGRKQTEERDRELLDIMFRRAMAQSTTNPTNFLVDSTEIIRTASGYDPLSVPEAAAIYSGVIAIFAFGGLSFDISARFLAVADELARMGAVDERFLYYRTLALLHQLLVGHWSEEYAIDLELVEEGIRAGQFWEASTCLDLDCYRQTYTGCFDVAQDRIDRLAEIVDLYENDLASSAMLGHRAFLHLERRELDAAYESIGAYYDEHSEILFNIIALGTRGRIECLRGDLERAEAEIVRAEALMKEAGRVPPFHASNVVSSRQLLDLLQAEARVVAGGSPTRAELRRLRRSRKQALAVSAKVPWRRTEALRLAGREAWLRGRRSEAIEEWERAVAFATELGARPELARTLEDAGRALSSANEANETSGALELGGRNGEACLEEATRLYAELGLSHELAALSREREGRSKVA